MFQLIINYLVILYREVMCCPIPNSMNSIKKFFPYKDQGYAKCLKTQQLGHCNRKDFRKKISFKSGYTSLESVEFQVVKWNSKIQKNIL